MNSETGLRKLRVKCDYFGHERRFTVVGVTQQPANWQSFWYEQEHRTVSVEEYFKIRWGKDLSCPGLPCLQLNKKDNCVPLELVTVLGAEHNLEVGKLRPEYQSDVSRLTTVRPQQRRKNIQDIIENDGMGPKAALLAKGMTLETSMLKVNGHRLELPVIQCDKGQQVTPGNYAANFKAVAPPTYRVSWGLWCFTTDDENELWGLARSVKDHATKHNLRFDECSFVDYPREAWWAIENRASAQELREALKQNLDTVRFESANSALLFVLLPSHGRKDDIYKFLKVHTETQLCSFATQCVVTPPPIRGKGKGGKGGDQSGIQQVERKLNNIMVKLPSKLRLNESSADTLNAQAAHNVRLKNPHRLLSVNHKAGSTSVTSTVVLGADVTHNAAGVSVAGVVATRGADFSTYFSELRAQSPFVLGADKWRTRKSEERILELTGMVASHLERWRDANGGRLPEIVLYYRDGVSDGQFKPVLTMELNQLVEAFRQSGGPEYRPKLVIIVGQKRHQTRLFPDMDEARGGRGSGKDSGSWQGGWGSKGGRADGDTGNGNVLPGTVAGEGIAQPGHLNFFLVSAHGIKGTSVPCHYHVLHADARLNVEAKDLEQVTFQLCHLYSRADKVVGYAAPAYYADHLCERGKLYLEAQYPNCIDIPSSAPASEDSEEPLLRKEVEDRCQWFNKMQADLCSSKGGNLQGRNFFC